MSERIRRTVVRDLPRCEVCGAELLRWIGYAEDGRTTRYCFGHVPEWLRGDRLPVAPPTDRSNGG